MQLPVLQQIQIHTKSTTTTSEHLTVALCRLSSCLSPACSFRCVCCVCVCCCSIVAVVVVAFRQVQLFVSFVFKQINVPLNGWKSSARRCCSNWIRKYILTGAWPRKTNCFPKNGCSLAKMPNGKNRENQNEVENIRNKEWGVMLRKMLSSGKNRFLIRNLGNWSRQRIDFFYFVIEIFKDINLKWLP